MSILRLSLGLLALNLCLWSSQVQAGQAPVFHVTVADPGAMAPEVESQVAAPIARLVGQIPGVTEFEVESSAGVCSARIVFAAKTDRLAAFTAVQQALNAAKGFLPVDSETPFLRRGDPREIAQFWISVSGDGATLAELSDAAGQIESELAQIAGTDDSQLIGATEGKPTVVWLNPHKLATVGATAGDVIQAIHDADMFKAKPEAGVRDLENLEVRVVNGARIQLHDVGRVEEQADGANGFARVDASHAVLLALSVTRGKVTAARVEEGLARLRPTLPHGIRAVLEADLSSPGFLLIDVAMPSDTSPAHARRLAEQVSDTIREVDARAKCLIVASGDTPAFRVLVGPGDHPADTARLRSRLAQLSDATVRICPIGGNGSLTPFPIRIVLNALDRAVLKKWGQAVNARLTADNSVIDPQVFPAATVSRLNVEIDRDAAERLGMPLQDLPDIARLCSGGALRLYFRGRRAVDVRLEQQKDQAHVLTDVTVRTDGGKLVPLAPVARITWVEEPTSLLIYCSFPAVRITASAPLGVTAASTAAKCVAAAAVEQKALKLSTDEYRVVDLSARGE